MLMRELIKRKRELEGIIEYCSSHGEKDSTSHIRISTCKGVTQYYEITDKNDTRGKYISKDDMDRVKYLMDKDYFHKVARQARIELAAIERTIAVVEGKGVAMAYENLCERRQAIVTPLEISDERYVEEWLSTPYEKEEKYNENTDFYTSKGERVKSKSEIIIANALNQLGIPYKYECPVYVGDRAIYIDFTVLRVRDRKECYVEHFGRMDDPSYVSNFMLKNNTYCRMGIQLGVNFFPTFESFDFPLNTKNLKEQFSRLFL